MSSVTRAVTSWYRIAIDVFDHPMTLMPTHYRRDAVSERYVIGPYIDLDQDVVVDGDGERITEARAEEIAAETLRQVRRGRPSLSGEPETSPRVSFRIPEQLRVRIEQRAEQEGRPVSEVAREALEFYLDRR